MPDRETGTKEMLLLRWSAYQPEVFPTETIPVAAVLPSDSPRIRGQDAEHVRTLAGIDTGLPPIVVHRPTMRVVDGMHRLGAAVLRGETRITARFFEGSAEDAFVLAVRLNAVQGLPLSQADRSSAAVRIIGTHPHWSDRMIAVATGLAHKSVASIRRRTLEAGEDEPADRIGRDGRRRPVNSAEGRLRASRHLAENPRATLREIAQVAGIAVGTARDVRLRVRQGRDPLPDKQRAADERKPRQGKVSAAEPAESAVVTRIRDRGQPFRDLRRDPSLRYTEAGRTLLRLLDAHAVGVDRWSWLLAGVPVHCRTAVAHAARGCAQSWLRFAQQLEEHDPE
ncbi:ParB/RepB/Spo0J family partition protein [Amycolatopsis sp. NPDC059021]|uniref:ParB/RepB/Spo0J family partition protein n=1 Tax=Amycolatopsis sp. NPDC059021 TaxID=3346704 RepID=UPI00367117F4